MTTGRFTPSTTRISWTATGSRCSTIWACFPARKARQSRILILTAPEATVQVTTKARPRTPSTPISWEDQWLPNGNLLITETRRGRAFEVNRQGEIGVGVPESRRQRHRRDPRGGHAAAGGVRPALQPGRARQSGRRIVGDKRVFVIAYVGPGAGLSAIGAFLAIVAGVFVAIAGFVWYPIKRLDPPHQGSAVHGAA